MTMERQHFVQQYVERQKAYIPTYTTEDIAIEHRTPSKQLRSDLDFGFDTPVLRPRAPVRLQPKPAELGSTSDARDHAKDKDKPKITRKRGSPADTGDEHTARLADRRERKRKKRAIVSPPKDDEENVRTACPRKGKASKPAALALMYGFSATNVTKGRLTLKPAPSLGVFSKGKASAKKKVTRTKKSTSRNELFSEFVFLNRPNVRSEDPSEIDGGSDDGSTPNRSVPQEARDPNRTKKDRGECTEWPALKKPSTRTTAGSEIWDIERESKLPSSACDVSSDPETKESAPVMLDPRGAEWSTSINVTEECEKRREKTRTSSLSVVPSGPRIKAVMICTSPSGSDLAGGLLATHAADVSSLHPSHSASQVGRRAADTQASDRRLVISKYFFEPKPVPEQEFIPTPELIMEPNDSMDTLGVEDQYVENTELGLRTIHWPASPMSVPVYVTEFRTQYDMVPQGNECPCEDCWKGVNVPSELVGGSDLGRFESAVVETQGDQYIEDVEQEDDTCDWYTGEYEAGYYPLVPEYEYGVEAAELAGEPWEACTAETDMDESICWGEDEGADFLQGRALLWGVEGTGWVGLSGLDEAERDVASRLRYHWRPLRL